GQEPGRAGGAGGRRARLARGARPGPDPDRRGRGPQRRDVHGRAAVRLRRLVAHLPPDPAPRSRGHRRSHPVSIDESALSGLRSTLEADDYRMAVSESGSAVEVTITAGPDACEDCLVPKPIMRNILH